jgi:hypothetical protein
LCLDVVVLVYIANYVDCRVRLSPIRYCTGDDLDALLSVSRCSLPRPPLWDCVPFKPASGGRDPRELRTPQEKGGENSI